MTESAEALRARKVQLEEAVLAGVKQHGADDVRVAELLGQLASVIGRLGDVRSERKLLERVLVLKENHFGADAAEMEETLIQVASSSGKANDVLRESLLLDRAITIAEKHHGDKHPCIAVMLDQLAAAWLDLGDPWARVALLQRALDIRKGAFTAAEDDRRHVVDVVQSQVDVAGSLLYVGQLSEAQTHVEDAFSLLAQTSTDSDDSESRTKRRLADELDKLKANIGMVRARRHVIVGGLAAAVVLMLAFILAWLFPSF